MPRATEVTEPAIDAGSVAFGQPGSPMYQRTEHLVFPFEMLTDRWTSSIALTAPPRVGAKNGRRHAVDPRQPRGPVAFLMTDIEGSTPLWESHSGAMQIAHERHDEIIIGAIAREDGYVFCRAGDSFGAAFTHPLRAARAAVQAQRLIAEEDWPDGAEIRVRMAVHLGEAHERDGNYFGLEVNRCARLLTLCSGGQVALSDVARRSMGDEVTLSWILRDIGPCALRGLQAPELVWRLESTQRGVPQRSPDVTRSES